MASTDPNLSLPGLVTAYRAAGTSRYKRDRILIELGSWYGIGDSAIDFVETLIVALVDAERESKRVAPADKFADEIQEDREEAWLARQPGEYS